MKLNIWRDLENATIDALRLFGGVNGNDGIVLERSFMDYINGFIDLETGREQRGLIAVVRSWKRVFPTRQPLKQSEIN